MVTLSIIVPVLNEAPRLTWLLPYLEAIAPEAQLIVVDGGSVDKSHDAALPFATVVDAARGRGVQMNAGAAIANGDVLWFVYADTHPRPDSVDALVESMENPKVVGGAFEYVLDAPGQHYRLLERCSNVKNRMFRQIYGDMGIFVRRSVFEKLGGFAPLPLMEDVDFCRQLKQEGKVVVLPQAIKTSARRWLEEGFIRYTMKRRLLQTAWRLGVPAQKLVKFYRSF